MSSVAKWLSVFLIAISSFGCACPNLREDLEAHHYLYDIDVKSQVCGQYKILDADTFKFQWVRDLPLKACDGFFAIAPETYQLVTRCAQSATCGQK